MADAGKTSDLRTVIVTECETMVRPDGRAGIRLETIDEVSQVHETIVFEVNQQAIAALRRALTRAEDHLQQSQNQSRN